MKKITYILIAMLTMGITTLTGCNHKNDNLIRVNEVTHSIFYAPLYIAMNNGYFEEENIEIELKNGGGSNVSMTALISNNADVALVGPETAVYTAAEGKKDAPKVFAQLTTTDGSFLVGRNKEPNFSWENLKGKEILGGRPGGMPAMTLEYVIKKHGLSIGKGTNQVDINYSIEFNNMTAAFVGGTGDYVTIFEPTASAIERENNGHIIASVGKEAGDVPFTAFVANESYIKNNRNRLEKFVTAIMKGYNFLMTASINEIIRALKPSFESFSDDDIKNSVNSYKTINAWSNFPVMKQSAYNNLINIITQAGKLNKNIPFNSIVDNSIANKVMNIKNK